MHGHALDPRQGRAANGVRAQECWADPWVSATEHKDETCEPDEQARDGNDAAENQSGRDGYVTLNSGVAHEVHGGCPFGFSVAVDKPKGCARSLETPAL